MPVTVSYFERALLGRIGGWWAKVGKDAATVDGTNADLAEPITSACRLTGIALADPTLAADADLASVAGTQLDPLLDVAEWRCLATVVRNWAKVKQKVSMASQDLSELGQRMQKDYETLTKLVRTQYGIGAATISFGTVSFDIDMDDDPNLPVNNPI